MGVLACLGTFAQDVVQEFGSDIIAATIKNRGQVFTQGQVVFDAGICERSYTITEWPKIKGFDRYFYLRYKPRQDHNPRAPLHDPKTQEGLYVAQNTVWYSNGQGSYCGFISEQHFNMASGNYAEALRNQIPMNAFNGLHNDGQCRIALPEGTFKHAGSSRAFYSNGVGAYCRLGHEFTNQPTIHTFAFDVGPATSFAYHGNCGG